MLKKPNIFDYATSELSQDAFLAWLFCWAENQYEKNSLHNCAIETLNLFMKTHLDEVNKIEIYKQEKHIDLIVAVDEKYFLVIEDKTNSSEHDNQLIRYKTTVENWLEDEEVNFDIDDVKYAYYKTGIVLTEERKTVENAGYNLIETSSIKAVFDKYKNCKNEIFKSYHDYLIALSEDYESVINKSYEDYKDLVSENPTAIYSFYKNLENKFKTSCRLWKVNSPRRHCFYTLTFGKAKWQNASVYFELDRFELRFRLHDFKGKKCQKDVAEIAYKKIENIIRTKKSKCIVEKSRIRSGGETMKIAVVNEKSWLVLSNDKIDIKKTAAKLQELEKLFFEN